MRACVRAFAFVGRLCGFRCMQACWRLRERERRCRLVSVWWLCFLVYFSHKHYTKPEIWRLWLLSDNACGEVQDMKCLHLWWENIWEKVREIICDCVKEGEDEVGSISVCLFIVQSAALGLLIWSNLSSLSLYIRPWWESTLTNQQW